MKINKKKSGLIFHNSGRGRASKHQEIRGYPVETAYKYLGVYIDRGVTGKAHVEYLKKRILKG